MHLVVGVVAEGSTDVVVLDEYLSTWVQELDDSVTLEVRPLQPAIDATSGRFGDGGWTWVKVWSSIKRRHADPHAGRHCLVATVRALETWIVAGLDPSIPEPEEVENPEQELMNLEPGLPTRRGRLRKNRGKWRRLAQKTRTRLAHIKSVCPHCEQFLSYFETAIDQPP